MPEATPPLRQPTSNLSNIKAILIPLDKRRPVHRRPSHGTPPPMLQAFPIPLGGTFTFGKKGRGNKVFCRSAGDAGCGDTLGKLRYSIPIADNSITKILFAITDTDNLNMKWYGVAVTDSSSGAALTPTLHSPWERDILLQSNNASGTDTPKGESKLKSRCALRSKWSKCWRYITGVASSHIPNCVEEVTVENIEINK